MTIGIALFIIFLGLLLYYLLSSGPPSDLVFSSSSEDEISLMQKYLTANGIQTYIKNRDIRRLREVISYLDNPSLHVIDSNDYKKAIELIQSQQKKMEQKAHERSNY
jgi:hypothetical protein